MPTRATTFVLSALLSFLFALPVFAQELEREMLTDVGDVKDFVVGPGKIELEVGPGQSKTFELSITNRLGVDRTFSIDLEDIAGSDDPTQAVVLLGDDAGPNSLRDFISLPTEEIAIKHGERVRVPITVSLPENAGPNGRYGSVVVSVASEPTPDQTGARSAIVSRIGTLVFIATPGERTVSGELEHFGVIADKNWLQKGPVPLGVLYKNTGNTHMNVYGEIRIYNMLNQEVGALQIEPWYVLPNASRLREVAWDKTPLFGRYTAVLSLYNGYDPIPSTATDSFYVVSWMALAVLVVIVSLLIYLITRGMRSRRVRR